MGISNSIIKTLFKMERDITPISPKEIKTYFLLAGAFKNFIKNGNGWNYQLLEKEYKRLQEYFWEMSEPELNDRLIDKKRLNRYDSLNWSKKTKHLSEIGVWPGMGGLDKRLTTGSSIETAENLKNAKKNRNGFYVPEKLIKKIDSMKRLTEFIYSNFPLIVIPKGRIREEYNRRAKNNGNPLCDILDFDIDDGSHRSVVYSLENMEKVEVYIGENKNNHS